MEMKKMQRMILETLLREYEMALMLDLCNDSYEIVKLSPRFAKSLSPASRLAGSVTRIL